MRVVALPAAPGSKRAEKALRAADKASKPLKRKAAPDPTVFCYMCSRRAGLASIGFHTRTCLRKWANAQKLLPPDERQGPPAPPKDASGAPVPCPAVPGKELDRYNAEAEKVYAAHVLQHCRGCGRKFDTKAKLQAHMARAHPMLYDEDKAAAAKAAKEAADAADANHSTQTGAFCYVCGRVTTSAAGLAWHARKCLARWDARDALRPRERQRARAGARPRLPADAPLPDADADAAALAAWNTAAKAAYEAHLPACPGCAGRGVRRAFESDGALDGDERLRRHMEAR